MGGLPGRDRFGDRNLIATEIDSQNYKTKIIKIIGVQGLRPYFMFVEDGR